MDAHAAGFSREMPARFGQFKTSSESFSICNEGSANRLDNDKVFLRLESLDRQVKLFKSQGEQAMKSIVQPLDDKMNILEKSRHMLEWQVTDIDGTVKALGRQLQSQKRHCDNLEAALRALESYHAEDRVRMLDYSRQQQEADRAELAIEHAVVSPPADVVTREEFEALREEVRGVQNECDLKPNRQAVVVHKELESKTNLVREDLRLEMRNNTDALVEQKTSELHSELMRLREDVGQLKTREGIAHNNMDSRTDVEQVIDKAVENLHREVKSWIDTLRRSHIESLGEEIKSVREDMDNKLDELSSQVNAVDNTVDPLLSQVSVIDSAALSEDSLQKLSLVPKLCDYVETLESRLTTAEERSNKQLTIWKLQVCVDKDGKGVPQFGTLSKEELERMDQLSEEQLRELRLELDEVLPRLRAFFCSRCGTQFLPGSDSCRVCHEKRPQNMVAHGADSDMLEAERAVADGYSKKSLGVVQDGRLASTMSQSRDSWGNSLHAATMRQSPQDHLVTDNEDASTRATLSGPSLLTLGTLGTDSGYGLDLKDKSEYSKDGSSARLERRPSFQSVEDDMMDTSALCGH